MKRTSSEKRFTVHLIESLEDIRKGEKILSYLAH